MRSILSKSNLVGLIRPTQSAILNITSTALWSDSKSRVHYLSKLERHSSQVFKSQVVEKTGHHPTYTSSKSHAHHLIYYAILPDSVKRLGKVQAHCHRRTPPIQTLCHIVSKYHQGMRSGVVTSEAELKIPYNVPVGDPVIYPTQNKILETGTDLLSFFSWVAFLVSFFLEASFFFLGIAPVGTFTLAAFSGFAGLSTPTAFSTLTFCSSVSESASISSSEDSRL
ncbi:hypothetical protein FF38_12485 [Lucilia cuprina]|uniref:Uncharacterized protein n=1 Tax=Lucilia cuprina TaxID=7375 RepID=A0A0L0BQH4_LUCCU|nr:hypothetical protein FF38_12485 [Lucilia cuprina]